MKHLGRLPAPDKSLHHTLHSQRRRQALTPGHLANPGHCRGDRWHGRLTRDVGHFYSLFCRVAARPLTIERRLDCWLSPGWMMAHSCLIDSCS
ncbi:hypothetical protein AALO_G00141700 [Alosa alosa]|uniref:Uncharacterized protein n=1 Tax=Alosa alosa TaxID=278164 RepID=A0AAV6GI65_9TELE|nr:hypothetical protein AALO_G00141700 [Alosa alosa]